MRNHKRKSKLRVDMKTSLSFLAAIPLCLSLLGCEFTSGSDDPKDNTKPEVTVPEVTVPEVTEPEVTEPEVTEPEPEITTIHMIGDSTMTQYDETRRPQAGWGEQVSMFVSSETTVENWARGGRSSRSFYYEEGRWNAVKDAINEGDYVIIQFAHNDQKRGGDYDEFGTYAYCSDGSTDGESCTDVEHSYYQFLKRYVEEARAEGATPLLMTPIVRKYFSGDTIRNSGLHNLESVNDAEVYPRGDYVAAMKEVAETYNVPIVDLTAETKSIVEFYGNESATESLYIAADSTHPQVLFATLIAKAAMEGLSELDILKNNIVSATSLIASPDALDWGNRYIDVPSVKTLTVSAFDLSPENGTVYVYTPNWFSLSDSDKSEEWLSSYSINYTNGAFTEKVFVQFNAASEQEYTDKINFELDGNNIGSVDVSGTGVAVGEGVNSYSSWFTEGSAVTSITDGLVTANDAVAVGLNAGSTKTLAVDGQDTSVARYGVFGESLVSRNEQSYVEFSVTAASQPFYIDTISAWLTTSGGSTVQADIEYSLSSDFSNSIKLNEEAMSFSKDTMTLKSFGVTAKVPAGETIYVRIFPWNAAGAASTGKYLALYDVKLSGISGD